MTQMSSTQPPPTAPPTITRMGTASVGDGGTAIAESVEKWEEREIISKKKGRERKGEISIFFLSKTFRTNEQKLKRKQ